MTGSIPATEYFSKSVKMLSLMKFDRKAPAIGLIAIKTLPYSGGVISSPP